jgi:phosphoglycolate phosphatase
MKAVLFDLDGTLIDSADDIGLCLQKTLKEIGLEEFMPPEVRSLIGGGVKALLQKVLGDRFEEKHVEIFRKHYLKNPVIYTVPFPGILETLEELKRRGIALAVVTNKMEDLSREILKILGLLPFFDAVIGGDTLAEKKPSPAPLIHALKLLGTEPESTLMVGDTDSDIISGRRAGTKTALALWGYTHSVSEKADYEVSFPFELVSLTGQGSGA